MNKREMFKIMLRIAKKYNLSVKCAVTEDIRYSDKGPYPIKYKSYRLFDENLAKERCGQCCLLCYDVDGTNANDYFQVVNGFNTHYDIFPEEDESIRTDNEELICKQIEKHRAEFQQEKQKLLLKLKQDKVAAALKNMEEDFNGKSYPDESLDFFEQLANM